MMAVDHAVDDMWSSRGNLSYKVDTSTESHLCDHRAGDTARKSCDDKYVPCAGVIHSFPQSTAPTITNTLYLPSLGKRTAL